MHGIILERRKNMDDLREVILSMHYDEFLSVGEIAGALRQDPKLVYEVIYLHR